MKTETELIERVKQMQAECETLLAELAALKTARRAELKIDDKVMVRCPGEEWKKRYFSHFDTNGTIRCFSEGATSWSTNRSSVAWDEWRLPTEEELK